MSHGVCRKGTVRGAVQAITLALVAVSAFAQTAPDWRRIGSTSVELMLAAPATGPVERVWFSADGSVLYARVRSGKIFQTVDFQAWTPASAGEPAPVSLASAVRSPEPGGNVVLNANGSAMSSLGRHLFRSEDGGHTWTNLTAWRS